MSLFDINPPCLTGQRIYTLTIFLPNRICVIGKVFLKYNCGGVEGLGVNTNHAQDIFWAMPTFS